MTNRAWWVCILNRSHSDPTETMRRSASSLLIRLAAACAGVVPVFLLHSAARAECGDYVIVGRPLLNPLNASPELRVKLALLSVVSHDSTTGHRGGPVPCHGPGCSRRDPVPAPSGPNAVVSSSVSELANLTARFFLSNFAPERLVSQFDLLIPHPDPDGIEHPPRIS